MRFKPDMLELARAGKPNSAKIEIAALEFSGKRLPNPDLLPGK